MFQVGKTIVSEDIIEASWQALADSFQYKLAMDNQADNQIGNQ